MEIQNDVKSLVKNNDQTPKFDRRLIKKHKIKNIKCKTLGDFGQLFGLRGFTI